jgi:acyl-CoA thioester hydrolase
MAETIEHHIKEIQMRWSDLDPNFHVRHSAYYDWGALCRIDYLSQHGMTFEVMNIDRFGPILFREECIFRRELKWGDHISVGFFISKARKDFSRWSFEHPIYKDGTTLSASLTVDGAWINVDQRKLITPSEKIIQIFSKIPRSIDFQWSD